MINRKIVIGARLSFLTSRAHVLCFGSSSIDREPVAVRTCARLRWRAHSDITPGLNRAFDTTPPAIQSAAIRCPTSQGSGNLRTAFERTTQPIARAVRIFQSLSFNPRVKHLKEPTRGLFHRLVVSKVLLLPAAVHAQNKAWSKQHGAPKISVPGA